MNELEKLSAVIGIMRAGKITDLKMDGIELKMHPAAFADDINKKIEEITKSFEEKTGMDKEEYEKVLFHSA